ncbi:MAG: hypothetical protein H7X80_04640 [bacterium]|nr:hypothetical protein [Candidatus Kapabacteria bacterium]
MPYAVRHQERARHIRSTLAASLLYITATVFCASSLAQPPHNADHNPDAVRTDADAWDYRAAAYDYASTLVQTDVGAGVDGGSLRVHPLWTLLPNLRGGFTIGASGIDSIAGLFGARLAYRMRMGVAIGADVLHSTNDGTIVSFDAAYDMGFYLGVRGIAGMESKKLSGEVFVGFTFPFINAP